MKAHSQWLNNLRPKGYGPYIFMFPKFLDTLNQRKKNYSIPKIKSSFNILYIKAPHNAFQLILNRIFHMITHPRVH